MYALFMQHTPKLLFEKSDALQLNWIAFLTSKKCDALRLNMPTPQKSSFFISVFFFLSIVTYLFPSFFFGSSLEEGLFGLIGCSFLI